MKFLLQGIFVRHSPQNHRVFVLPIRFLITVQPKSDVRILVILLCCVFAAPALSAAERHGPAHEKRPCPDCVPNRSVFYECVFAYSCFWALIFTPGPMVEAVTQERMYWPFAAAGFALMMAVMRAA